MSELTEFLLARIAEDESAAQAVVNSHAMWDWESYVAQAGMYEEPASEYAQRMNPARVLAECAAKRRIVYLSDGIDIEVRNLKGTPGETLAFGRRSACDVALRALASIYAEHEGFREEWR